MLLEVFLGTREANLVPIVAAGRDVEQVDINIVACEYFHEGIEYQEVPLVERRRERHILHGLQIVERRILRDSQDRDTVQLDDLARNATNQVGIFAVCPASTHDDKVRTVFLSVSDDFLFRQTFAQSIVKLPLRQLAGRHLSPESFADAFHVGYHLFAQVLQRVFLLQLIGHGVANRSCRGEERAVVSVHNHDFRIMLLGIVDTDFAGFQRIIGEVHRDKHLEAVRLLGFLLVFLLQPFAVFDNAQRMRQVAFFDSYPDAGRDDRLYLVHVVDVNLDTFRLEHRLQNLRFLVGMNRQCY